MGDRTSTGSWMAAMAVAAAAAQLAACGAKTPPPPPERVVLVTLDTFRCDHLASFGYARDTAPFLDSLFAKGVLFRRAVSSCSRTAPAHSSIFTGLYPFQHGVIANGDGLPTDAWTLVDAARGAGYAVAGFSAVRFLVGRIGFPEGDDVHRGRRRVRGPRLNLNARQQVNRVTAWLDTRPEGERELIWVHFFDAHSWRNQQLTERLYSRPSPLANDDAVFDLAADRRGVLADHFGTRERLLAAYDAYDSRIAFIDDQLRRLYAYFERRGWLDRTLWVVVADHGEGLGAHGYDGHALRLYEDQVRVPLAFIDGGRRFEPRTIDEPVRSLDILPTIIDLIGGNPAEIPAGVVGASLAGVLRGDEATVAPRVALSQRRKLNAKDEDSVGLPDDLTAVQDRRYKLIVGSDGSAELYDLLADRYERSNLAGSGIAEERALAAEMNRMFSTFERLHSSSHAVPLDDETLSELRALGYVQ